MTSRFRLALVAGLVGLSGCSEYNAGPIEYKPTTLLRELKDDKGKPKSELQRRVESSVAEVFGASPQSMIVPKGSGMRDGGAWLANRTLGPDKKDLNLKQVDGKKTRPVEGGYALYRTHCLHCHGVSGDGNGPTAAFLWPRPRNYQPGIFKFTSTKSVKPTRDDLRRVLHNGIANTSMPSFEVTLTSSQIEQLIDYVIFLSARGETEKRLIGEALAEDEPADSKAPSPIDKAKAEEVAQAVFEAWNGTETDVLAPEIPKPPSTPESIARGRILFLGIGDPKVYPKLECAGCHGPEAKGNGPSFVPYDMFREVVFGGDPAMQDERLKDYIAAKSEGDSKKADSIRDLWVKGSLDEWGNPLRPANLNLGYYKGGRRPIDIYWRIAKGINGAKMPAHANVLKPDQIWDLVNFVLALPYEPNLLRVPPASLASSAAH